MSGLKVANLSPIVRQFLQRTTLYTSIEGMTWKGSLETSFQKLGIVEIVFCNPNTSPITRYREGFYCRKNFAYIFVNIKCFFLHKIISINNIVIKYLFLSVLFNAVIASSKLFHATILLRIGQFDLIFNSLNFSCNIISAAYNGFPETRLCIQIATIHGDHLTKLLSLRTNGHYNIRSQHISTCERR